MSAQIAWVKRRIGDDCLVGDGAHAKMARQDVGILYLTSKNFKAGGLDLSKVEYISEEDFRRHFKSDGKALTLPKGGDVVFSIIGSIGEPYLVKGTDHFGLSSSVAILRPDKSVVLPDFLYNWLRGPIFQNALYGIKGGVAQGYVSLEMIKSLPLMYPPLSKQKKIADILSGYDDLIENNTRRIKILEEMALAIYREWFVHFRFPGHEKIKLVDSPFGKIPEGWEVTSIEKVCASFQDGDWIETKDQGGDDYRLLQVSNIGVGEFIETGNFRYITQDTFIRLRCTEVVPGDILIARMPRPTGRAWLVTEMPWRMITAVDVAVATVDAKKTNAFFLVQYLNSEENLRSVEKHQTGTTRPRISRSNLGALHLVVPPVALQERFERFATSAYELITSLRSKNRRLQQARDMLLPKLISGAIPILHRANVFSENSS